MTDLFNASASVMPRAPVVAYCAEEVRRQGHDVTALDGIARVGWMLEAWSTALGRAEYPVNVWYVETLGRLVEREKNGGGFRGCVERVGSHLVPSRPEDIRPRLQRLFEHWGLLSPLSLYREFEEIHPFADGNGRVGKILLNWKNGTLLDPVFPPRDFWGAWVDNP